MRTVEGRILEIGPDSLFVLTSEGEFLERPLPPYEVQVGDEITVKIPGAVSLFSQFVPFSAAAALFVFLLFQSVVTMSAPVYYVHLDINSSIELGLSENLRVIEVTPLNNEGKQILNKVNVKDLPVQTAIKTLVRTAGNMDYIAPEKDNTVFISIVSTKEKDMQQELNLSEKVQKAANQQLKEGKAAATLAIALADKKKREEAISKHRSINTLVSKEDDPKENKIPGIYRVFRIVPHPDNKPDHKKDKKDDPGVRSNDNRRVDNDEKRDFKKDYDRDYDKDDHRDYGKNYDTDFRKDDDDGRQKKSAAQQDKNQKSTIKFGRDDQNDKNSSKTADDRDKAVREAIEKLRSKSRRQIQNLIKDSEPSNQTNKNQQSKTKEKKQDNNNRTWNKNDDRNDNDNDHDRRVRRRRD